MLSKVAKHAATSTHDCWVVLSPANTTVSSINAAAVNGNALFGALSCCTRMFRRSMAASASNR
jgi:hypothetical protein